MEERVVTIFERAMTTTVNDIEHIESQSYTGVSVIQGVLSSQGQSRDGLAQITAMAQSITRGMPPGIFPPTILKYDASSVPILQLGLESKTLSEQEMHDLGQNFIRTPLATVQGRRRAVSLRRQTAADRGGFGSGPNVCQASLGHGCFQCGKSAKLDSSGRHGEDCRSRYQVRLNSSPEVLAQMNDLPVKTVNGATIYLKDVATVHDGFAVQTNIVRTNGTRGALLTVMRTVRRPRWTL